MTRQELQIHLLKRFPTENESCEWKAFQRLKHAISSRPGDDIISYVSAIANIEGGQLIVGVEDATLNIPGIEDFYGYTKENIPLRIQKKYINLSPVGLYIEELITSDTKYKAFNQQYYQDFIIEAIKQHGSLSRKDVNELLIDKLSDSLNLNQKKIKINNILAVMRKKQIIQNTGSDRNPLWVLIDN